MIAAAPHLAGVVLDPEAVARPAALGGGVAGELRGAAAALRRARGVLAGATTREALSRALDEPVSALRPAVEAALPAGAERAPCPPVHAYFGVRSIPLGPRDHTAQVRAVLHRALSDLRHAPVDVNDAAAELAAFAEVLDRLAGDAARGEPPGTAPATPYDPSAARPAASRDAPPAPNEPSGDALDRWFVVHHAYFLLNLYAASAVTAATAALGAGRSADAARLLDRATVLVGGLTATMVHSAAIPADLYAERVRPTMSPPAAPIPLTGAMQPEHARFRAAMDGLVARLDEPFAALARRDPALALARDALLEADLLDIERHVLVAAGLVGSDRSLVQHELAPDNGVGVLRRMRHARAGRYCPLMRFGDRDVAVAATGAQA